ncbi:hypothetical protein QAD02_023030 [Eretmocerus hayati]|uniref:Uncharacterized protein n=1 Tax=Eretmocerus hayati TaxID=131215 RepID=A0ACC2PWT2_9HYME|nr:hypothetical protein QAD02_023030 [Eretmocerus hayati]
MIEISRNCFLQAQTTSHEKQRSFEKTGFFYQFLTCALVNVTVLGPSMGFGYSAVVLPTLKSNTTEGLHVDEQQASWIASAAAIGTPFGCILSSFVLRRGRKNTLLITSGTSLISWLIIAFSKTYDQILGGRFLSGIAIGLASVSATVYAAEVTSPALRSTTLTWTSITIAGGVVIVYTFGYIFQDNWEIIALLCALFPAVSILLTVAFVPETPVWLKNHGRSEKAAKVLRKFNGLPKNYPMSPDLEAQLKPTILMQTKRQKSILKKLASRKAMEPFIIMVCFFFFQQFSGIFAVIYYAVEVSRNAGLTISGYLGAILIGLTRLCGSIALASVSEKLGRRLPSIVSGIGMTIFMASLSIYLYLKDCNYSIDDGGLIPAVCVIMFIFFSTIGFLTLPFAMIGEIYPTSVKDILPGVTTSLGYIFSFIVVKTYADMSLALGKHGIFCFYAVMSFFGTLFVIIWLPETKNKSLTEIENLFGSKKKDKISVMTITNGRHDKEAMIPLKDVTKNCA